MHTDIGRRQTGQRIVDGQIVNRNVPRRLVTTARLRGSEAQLNGITRIGRNIGLYFLPAVSLGALCRTDIGPRTAIGRNLHVQRTNLGTEHVAPENDLRIAQGVQEDQRRRQRGRSPIECGSFDVDIVATTARMIGRGTRVVGWRRATSATPMIGLVERRATCPGSGVARPTGVNG